MQVPLQRLLALAGGLLRCWLSRCRWLCQLLPLRSLLLLTCIIVIAALKDTAMHLPLSPAPVGLPVQGCTCCPVLYCFWLSLLAAGACLAPFCTICLLIRVAEQLQRLGRGRVLRQPVWQRRVAIRSIRYGLRRETE